MRQGKQITTAKPGEITEWVMLGYLAQALETRRKITIDDWNDAVEAAKRSKNEALDAQWQRRSLDGNS
jgi:hypothetical protein